MRVLLVVPAHNEEKNIERVIGSIVAAGYDYVVVNDGSTDHTLQICQHNRFNYLDLKTNLGLAGAFQAGMKYAHREDYDCAIQFDGDGQHRADCVHLLMEQADVNDVVIGSRFVTEPRPRSMRMVGNALISWAIRVTTGKVVNDPTSGMRLYNQKMIELLSSGANYDPEPDTIALLLKRGASVKEVQVSIDERIAGESYFNPISAMKYMLKQTISILFIQFFRK